MENKGIWDIISKLTAPLNKNEQPPTPNDIDQDLTNQNEQSERAPTFGDSYLKSYNPFSSPLIKKPQISSSRAERPARSVIDLKASKNLTNGKQTDKTRNIIELINRHNYYSQKITKKPPNGR